MRVLVTGASGYIGGRLVPELLERGHAVVAGARTPDKLEHRPWRDRITVARLDVQDRGSLEAAFRDVDAVYHLVHSMDGDGDFRQRDREAAANVRDAAATAGVRRIIYLGGLGRPDDNLSPHLLSRHEVGRVLADGSVPVTELRAAIIIGSGSASFEMLRNLTEVLPVMTTPRWVDTRCQPIAVRDVLGYLCDVLEVEETAGRVLEIGGPDVLTYRGMMHLYADVAGLRRRVILPVPVLSPQLSSLWVGLVTPLPTGLARPLVGSLVNEVVVDDPAAQQLLPRRPLPFRRAVELALGRVQDLDVATTWASAGAVPEDPLPADPEWAGGRVATQRWLVASSAPADRVFTAVESANGAPPTGLARLVWRARTAAGRSEPASAWRLVKSDPPRFLRLRSTLRMPGMAWLEYRVHDRPPGSVLEVRVRFHPRGLFGRAYWLVSSPTHRMVFGAMAEQLAREAERGPQREAAPPAIPVG